MLTSYLGTALVVEGYMGGRAVLHLVQEGTTVWAVHAHGFHTWTDDRNPSPSHRVLGRWDRFGQRTTDCCGSYSTYMEVGDTDVLCCKRCYRKVPEGQGDGCSFADWTTPEEYYPKMFAWQDAELEALRS